MRRELDTAALNEDDRARLAELWEAAQEPLFHREPGSGKSHPDEKQYAVTVVNKDGAVRTAETRELSASPAVADLLEWIRARVPPTPSER